MATLNPIEADLLNALKSAGPFAPSGKDVSSQNVLKSGLDSECQFVYGEDQADFSFLQVEYFDRFQPFTPEERFQVDTLIRSEWSIRRLYRVESHLWEYHAMLSDRSSGVPLGEGFSRASEVFMRLQRRVNASERSYKEAYKELGRLQGIRTSASAPALAGAQPQLQPQPQPQPPEPCGAGVFACQPQMPPQPEPQPSNGEKAPLGLFLKSPQSSPAAASAAASASAPPEPQPGSVAATPVVVPEGGRVLLPLPPRSADLARRMSPAAFQ